jgi:predicted nucleic acid-binding protein
VILVDSSIWIDHLRRTIPALVKALESGLVLCHPFVTGEFACGHLRDRIRFLDALADMPTAPVATHAEALTFLDRHALAGRGIGWVDVHLLASTALAGGTRLWTHDKRLAALAADIGLGYSTEAY